MGPSRMMLWTATKKQGKRQMSISQGDLSFPIDVTASDFGFPPGHCGGPANGMIMLVRESCILPVLAT